jgi:hypothetical protein
MRPGRLAPARNLLLYVLYSRYVPAARATPHGDEPAIGAEGQALAIVVPVQAGAQLAHIPHLTGGSAPEVDATRAGREGAAVPTEGQSRGRHAALECSAQACGRRVPELHRTIPIR